MKIGLVSLLSLVGSVWADPKASWEFSGGAGKTRLKMNVFVPSERVQESDDPIIPATFVADTKLPTSFGHFRMRAYRIPGNSIVEPVIIYSPDKPPFAPDGVSWKKNVPIRIHD